MDSIFAIQYDGGVILAADQSNARSILVYQKNLDKVVPLTSHSAMAVSGPNCDLVNFSEYIQKNLQLYELANEGTKLNTAAQANFCRNELATAIRKGPYQVNILLAGYDVHDKEGEGSAALYYLDYMGTLHKVKYGSQGYALYFCMSTMDRDYVDGLKEEDALKIIHKCIHEIETRFLINQPNFIIKAVDKDGVRTISFGSDPADN